MLCFPVAPNHSLNERGCNLAQIWGRRLQSLEIDCDNDDDNNWMCSFFSRLQKKYALLSISLGYLVDGRGHE